MKKAACLFLTTLFAFYCIALWWLLGSFRDVLVDLLPGQAFPAVTRLSFEGRALLFVLPLIAFIGSTLASRRGTAAGMLLHAGTLAVTCMVLSLVIGLAVLLPFRDFMGQP